MSSRLSLATLGNLRPTGTILRPHVKNNETKQKPTQKTKEIIS